MSSDLRPVPRGASSPLAGLALAALLTGACATVPPPPAELGTGGDQPAPITVTPQVDWRDAILYFVVLDRFADGDASNNAGVDRAAKGAFHGGDLEGLRRQLDELAELGVTAVWITPVVKNIDGFVTGAGFPDWGYHGYWADDFTRLDPRFGSEEALAALVEDAHARGIKVLLDVVYNHAGYDSAYTTAPQTRGWFRTENTGTCGSDDLTSCLAGLPDFKTDLPEVRDHLLNAHLGLATRVGLDGFRLDTVKHVEHDFWQEHRRRLDAELGEQFFLVGEVWGGDAKNLDPWFAGDEMDAGLDFSFQGSTIGFLLGRGRPVAFNRYLEKRHDVREGHHLAHFLSSHDVRGGLDMLEGDVDLFRLAALLQFTVSGIPTVYYGEEVARPGGDWPENRSDMPWGERDLLPGAGLPRDEALREDYRRLIALRRAHPALWRGGHRGVHFDKHLLVFERADPESDDAVIVAVNRGGEPVTAGFDLPAAWDGRQLQDVWGGEALAAEGGRLEMEIAARSARIVTAN